MLKKLGDDDSDEEEIDLNAYNILLSQAINLGSNESQFKIQWEETLKQYPCGIMKCDYKGNVQGHLDIKKGAVVWILKKYKDGWSEAWSEGKQGYIPSSYFELYKK